jgi:hypothetical protein
MPLQILDKQVLVSSGILLYLGKEIVRAKNSDPGGGLTEIGGKAYLFDGNKRSGKILSNPRWLGNPD